MPLAAGHLKLEVDGEDVTDKVHKKGDMPPLRNKLNARSKAGKNGQQGSVEYPLCLWVAHPMTPGEHTLGLSCVPPTLRRESCEPLSRYGMSDAWDTQVMHE